MNKHMSGSGAQPMNEIHISAIAFQEGDAWVVQGIEYDIVAHTDHPSKVPAAFIRAVFENACIGKYLGLELLKGIKPAPEHFREMYEQAPTWVGPVSVPPHLPVAGVDIRLASNPH
jgi:hypothetical protein